MQAEPLTEHEYTIDDLRRWLHSANMVVEAVFPDFRGDGPTALVAISQVLDRLPDATKQHLQDMRRQIEVFLPANGKETSR